jgi:hypothetical protein
MNPKVMKKDFVWGLVVWGLGFIVYCLLIGDLGFVIWDWGFVVWGLLFFVLMFVVFCLNVCCFLFECLLFFGAGF